LELPLRVSGVHPRGRISRAGVGGRCYSARPQRGGRMLPLVLLVACGPTFGTKEEAKGAVEGAFAQANPAGRTGMELGGKAVWLSAFGFDEKCLEEKDLAFNDNPNKRYESAQS